MIVHAKGDRRGVGATNHCMHGKDAVIEEILDWRPYDYLTDRSTMATPDGPVRFLTTVELEPTTDGTIIHTRFAAPTSARERAIVERLMPAFREVLAESDRGLSVQLDDEHRSRSAAPPDEPVLPAPGRGGPLDT